MEGQTEEDQKGEKQLAPECLLCKSDRAIRIYDLENHKFLHCPDCGTVYRDSSTFLTPIEEKARYQLHVNDVNDPGYQQFVQPIIRGVKNAFPIPASGLDFGAGTGPVISKLLRDHGYDMQLYDPFFHPDTSVLNRTYNFIVCCEVIEHFHDPELEFMRLFNLLSPGGRLFCMTDPLPKTEFEDWYYKNDPTHVVFYSKENLNWVKTNVGFADLFVEGRLIIFKK